MVTYTAGGRVKMLAAKYYNVSYRYNIYADDRAAVVVTGKGNYKGTLTKNFSITSKDISKKGIAVTVGRVSYDERNNITGYPAIAIRYAGKTLRKGIDYEVITTGSFDLSKQAEGKISVKIKAVSGSDFSGVLIKTINVRKPKA